ncbi:MAG: hypothetical protein AAFY08_01695 [Planctomycetota bacterium]
MTSIITRLLSLVSVAVWAVVPAVGVAADVVEMKDGRVFEGRIVKEDDTSVRIDAMIAGIRAEMALAKGDIASVTKEAVLDDFFEPVVAPATATGNENASSYLLVPIKGELGTDVVSSGVARALSLAAGRGIGHVVFEIDSAGGSPEAAAEIHRTLARYDSQIAYHAVMNRALAEALVFPVFADTVHLRDGGRVGAEGVFIDSTGEGEALAVGEVAAILGETAAAHGRSDLIVRAMVDPDEVVVAWQDASGQLQVASVLPEDVDEEAVLFDVDDETLLVLSAEELDAWGVARPFTGSIGSLGEVIGVEGWTSVGDQGAVSMRQERQAVAQRAASKERGHEDRIKALIQRRELVQRSIQRNLARAEKWQPSQEDIRTYQSRGRTGSGYFRRSSDVKDTNVITRTSRSVWRQKTDLSISALREARKGVMEMQRLDREAAELGLDRLYAPDELSAMKNDIEVRAQVLMDYRGIKTR